MKKLFLTMILICFCLSACAQSDTDEVVFSVSSEEKKEYSEKMISVLNSFYWKFDSESIAFSEETVPNENEALFAASDESGYPLKENSGKKCVKGEIELLHFNEEKAGTAYFVFSGKKLIGAYYSPVEGAEEYYGLKSRNVYLLDPGFSSLESESADYDTTKTSLSFPESGFLCMTPDSENSALLAVDMETYISIYRVRSGAVSLYKNIYFESGKYVMSACFSDSGSLLPRLAVLLGVETDASENHYGKTLQLTSDKIVFFDASLEKLPYEMDISEGNCHAIAYDDESLLISNEKKLESYVFAENAFSLERQYYMEHGSTGMALSDLDNNGVKEYLLTDGMDFYIYRKGNFGFWCLWKTHLGIESHDNVIYTGDLNGDGVKEIYICDKTQTTIKYILSNHGIISSNENIEYGQRFFVGDFDNNGKSDYIKIEDSENSAQNLYMAN